MVFMRGVTHGVTHGVNETSFQCSRDAVGNAGD